MDPVFETVYDIAVRQKDLVRAAKFYKDVSKKSFANAMSAVCEMIGIEVEPDIQIMIKDEEKKETEKRNREIESANLNEPYYAPLEEEKGIL